jgi:transposase-like protein
MRVVQLGSVAGTAFAAVLNLAAVVPARPYYAVSALSAALSNALLVVTPTDEQALLLRFPTCSFLAGVSSPAIKMIATWFRAGRGLASGTLLSALTGQGDPLPDAGTLAVSPLCPQLPRRGGTPLERGVAVSYESVRTWVNKFGERFATAFRRRERRPGCTWHHDEVFLKIRGEQVYLWRAVEEHGQVVVIVMQQHRDDDAAERFLRRLLDHTGEPPERIRTDKLASYAAAKKRVPELAGVEHHTVHSGARLNNRVEQAICRRKFGCGEWSASNRSIPSSGSFPSSVASAITSVCAAISGAHRSTAPCCRSASKAGVRCPKRVQQPLGWATPSGSSAFARSRVS